MMRVRESATSRINQLIKLTQGHCPDLVPSVSDMHITFKSNSSNEVKLGIYAYMSPIFADGEWRNIDISVFDEEYFECAKSLAESYENISQKSVTIVKQF